MVIHKWYIKASSALQQRIYCSQNKLHKEGVSGAVEEKCMERERGQRWFCILGAAEKRVFGGESNTCSCHCWDGSGFWGGINVKM